jgi:RNA polymerase sigma-70 factor (ECF subfamily)
MTDLKLFNQLFAENQSKFIRFANSYVRDLATAEDFVMEAFMYYWKHAQELAIDTNAPAYILTIIKHKCLNHLQHLTVRTEVAERMQSHAAWELSTRISTLEACDPEDLFSVEVQQIVTRTLQHLPEQTRRVFIMSRVENLSHKTIAERQKITIKGVEYHISKVLKILHAKLKDYYPLAAFFFD